MSEVPQITIRHGLGNVITVPNQLNVRALTYLTDNTAVSQTVLPVENASPLFSATGLVLLSSMGSQNAETSQNTAVATTSVTVLTTTQAHARGDTVQQINYDQYDVEKGPTALGPFVPLITGSFINVTQQQSITFDLTGLSTEFYRARWRNSLTGDLSAFSDPVSVDTYPINSVANIIYPVLTAMGVSENDPKINTTFLLSAVNDARIYVQNKLYGIRQDWQAEFEHPLKVLAGRNYVDLPDNIDFNTTDRSLLAARFLIGNILAPFNMRYIDKRTWNQVSWSVMGGTTTTDTAIAAGTINLNSSGDFPNTAGGVAYVATTDFDQTILQIQYTSVDLITNQLLGVTGVTRAFPTGTQVWANPNINQPIFYTVFENKIWFDAVLPDAMQGNNLWIDYYKVVDQVVDLYQELPEHYRYAYGLWLRYAVKYRKDITLSNKDPDLVKFEEVVQALFNSMYTGQESCIITA